MQYGSGTAGTAYVKLVPRGGGSSGEAFVVCKARVTAKLTQPSHDVIT